VLSFLLIKEEDMISNPNGEGFDPDGIPRRSTDLFFGNYPIKDRPRNM
jgi:hypothetical protein